MHFSSECPVQRCKRSGRSGPDPRRAADGLDRRALWRLALLAVIPVIEACYTVTVTPAGYQRTGVWLPRRRSTPSQPAEKLTLEDGTELRFDDELGVYRLEGPDDVFYSAGRFFRREPDGTFSTARSADGHWQPAPRSQLPPSLRRQSK